MNKLYKDYRKGYEEFYWVINCDEVYHLINKLNKVYDSEVLKKTILKTDYLVLEYI